MNNYLIEGLSGTGKTTVCQELQKKGYNAIDADEVFAYFRDPDTGLPTKEETQFNLMWDEKKVHKALNNTTMPTFVCGGLAGKKLDKFLLYFKKTFILYVDDDTLKSRILTRKNNDFGKNPEDLARQLEWNKGTKEYAQQKGAILIDATKSIQEVVQEIVRYVENKMKQGSENN